MQPKPRLSSSIGGTPSCQSCEQTICQEKEKFSESHIFIIQKRLGEIKGRTVAGGNKQQGYIDKEDASSPTVFTESMILTSMIDAIKEQEIVIVDIPNAFTQMAVTDEEKRVIVCISMMLVDILVKIAPDIYKDNVTVNKKGEKQILVECLNTLNGTMIASLLYYQKFTARLDKAGFEINPLKTLRLEQECQRLTVYIFFSGQRL